MPESDLNHHAFYQLTHMAVRLKACEDRGRGLELQRSTEESNRLSKPGKRDENENHRSEGERSDQLNEAETETMSAKWKPRSSYYVL